MRVADPGTHIHSSLPGGKSRVRPWRFATNTSHFNAAFTLAPVLMTYPPSGPVARPYQNIASRRPAKLRRRCGGVKTKISGRQRPALLLPVVVILVHHARATPSPEDAPAHSVGSAGNSHELDCPGRMRLAGNLSGNLRHSNLCDQIA